MEALLIILFTSLMFNAMFAAYFIGHKEFLDSVEQLLEKYEQLKSKSSH